MGAIVSADNLTLLAVRLEKRGSEFYRQAAARTSEPELTKRFGELADEEAEHAERIRALARELREASANPEAVREMKVHGCLKAFVEGRVVPNEEDIDAFFADLHGTDELLKKAINAEKDMIALLTGLKAFLGDDRSREVIDRLIADELGHIALLNDVFEDLIERT